MSSEQIRALGAASLDHDFVCVRLDGTPAYLGVDPSRHYALIVPVADGRFRGSYRTDSMVLKLGASCSVAFPDGDITSGWFHILLCESDDPKLSEVFLNIACSIARQLEDQQNLHHGLLDLLRRCVELFRINPAPDLESERVGLWGELFVILESAPQVNLLEYWHSSPEGVFDFACLDRRIEVKATTRAERIHLFSHAQLMPAPETDVMVASAMLQTDDEGLSLGELIERVRQLASTTDSLVKLERAIRHAGMHGEESGPRFNESLARANLNWYTVDCIPRFPMPEPTGVSHTHYQVDLTSIPSVGWVEALDWLSHWQARGSRMQENSKQGRSVS